MDLEMTFDDPKWYTRQFTIKTSLRLLPDTDILEAICAENDKDRAHLGNSRPNALARSKDKQLL